MQQKKKQAKTYKPFIAPKQIKNMMNELQDMRKQKAANIEFRRNIIEAQNRYNYLNELHRLQGFLSTYTLPQLQEDRIKNRISSLKSHYSSSLEGKVGGSLYKDSILRFCK